MQSNKKTLSSRLTGAVSFIGRQHRDWKVTVMRTSIDKFVYQMVLPYLSLFIVALGASALQLGIVTSVGMAIAGVISPLLGMAIDKVGVKKIYLLGIGLLIFSYLTYSLANNWVITIIAMAAYWIGFSSSILSCATLCGNCLANRDRATGMMFCETIAAGLMGMAGPMLGAWVVARSGTIDAESIRPLFYIALILTALSFALVLTQLSKERHAPRRTGQSYLGGLSTLFKEGRHLKQWLFFGAMSQLPLSMVFPFSQVFAHQIKGADQYLLGAIITSCAVTSIVFAMPLGRFADIFGRKKALFFTIPLFWISNLVLIWAPNPAFLILAGILQGFYYIGSPITMAMERELVPQSYMGSWVGLTRFFRMMVNAGLALIAGVIWDRLGPQYVFLIFIGLDLIRLPLLITMPETLRLNLEKTPAKA